MKESTSDKQVKHRKSLHWNVVYCTLLEIFQNELITASSIYGRAGVIA